MTTPFFSPVFVCDDMLGRLAKGLRMVGYFAHYFRKIDDARLVELTKKAGHVLLTRDTLILPRRNLGPHLFVKSDFHNEQLDQVVRDLRLPMDKGRAFTICLECNVQLGHLEPENARGLVPPYVFSSQESFARCPYCRRIYWQATHRSRMDENVAALFSKGGDNGKA